MWTDPVWVGEAHGWIQRRLDEAGLRLTAPVEQLHVQPWSTVLRVPTAAGDYWFKANIPACAHEAAVVSVLAQRRPDCVPELLAVDVERGWMLMGQGGERLREVIERERISRACTPGSRDVRAAGGLRDTRDDPARRPS